MKRGTPAHPKTLALAAALGLERWGAVGLLESLWHFALTYARRGDVGRHGNAAIAASIGWTGDADRLVEALTLHGWLDACSCHRLRVHDWKDHADQAVHKSKEVMTLGFLPCYSVAPSSGDLPEVLHKKDRESPEGINPPPATATATAPEQGKAPATAGGVQGGNGPPSKLDDYCRAIWSAHCRRRGSELPEASGPEYELMRSWYEAGIPVRIVLRGVQDTKAVKPNLTYYAGSVKDAAEYARKARAS